MKLSLTNFLLAFLCLNTTFCFSQNEANLSPTASIKIDSLSADSLYQLGQQLIGKHQLKEAAPVYEQCLSFYKETNNRERTLSIHQWLCGIYIQIGQFQKSIDISEAAINFVKADPRGDGWRVGMHMSRMAEAYLYMGQIEKAEQTIQEGMIVQQEFVPGPSRILSGLHFNLGLIYMDTGRFEESIKEFDTNIKYEMEMHGKRTRMALISMLNQGIIYRNLQQNNKAHDYLSEVLDSIDHQKSNEDLLPHLYQYLGNIYSDWQESEKALFYLEKADHIGEVLFQGNPVYHIILKVNLADAYSYLGQTKKAIEVYQQGRDLATSLEATPPYLSNIYEGLSYAYQTIGDYEKSLQNALLAVETIESLSKSNKAQHAKAHKLLGFAYANMGENEKALIQFQNSLEIIEANYGLHSHFKKAALSAMANHYLSIGEREKALEYSTSSLYFLCSENAETQKSPLQCINNLKEFGNLSSNLAILSDHANILTILSENGTNKVENLQKALELYEAGSNLLAQRNAQLEISSSLRSSESLIEFTHQAIKVAYDLYEETNKDSYKETAFGLADLGKAVLLEEARKNAEAQSFLESSDQNYIAIQRLNRESIVLEKRILEAEEDQNDSLALALRNDFLFPLRLQLSELEKSSSLYKNQSKEWKKISSAEVLEYLDSETVLIEYILQKQEEETHLYALCLDRDNGLSFEKSLLPKDYESNINNLQKLLKSHNLTRGDRKRKFVNTSRLVYDQFVKPIEDRLIGKQKVVIIGEGLSNYIPFEVLVTKASEAAYADLPFLIKNYEISYHYSAKLFVDAKQSSKQFENDLLAFAPVFNDESGNAMAFSENTRSFLPDTIFRSIEKGQFQPLLHSQKEVTEISNLFSEKEKVQLLLHKEANEESLKSLLTERFQFVHLATHSFANIDHPKFSGVACASKEDQEDGILYVGEIYNMNIASDLVVLSSCESGVGQLIKGEGMLGLNRSFIYAGASNVVFSLWEVEDQATSQLMTHFYKEILQGKNYSSALRKAKLSMLQNKLTASPDYWGAFLLIGV